MRQHFNPKLGPKRKQLTKVLMDLGFPAARGSQFHDTMSKLEQTWHTKDIDKFYAMPSAVQKEFLRQSGIFDYRLPAEAKGVTAVSPRALVVDDLPVTGTIPAYLESDLPNINLNPASPAMSATLGSMLTRADEKSGRLTGGTPTDYGQRFGALPHETQTAISQAAALPYGPGLAVTRDVTDMLYQYGAPGQIASFLPAESLRAMRLVNPQQGSSAAQIIKSPRVIELPDQPGQ